jgi:predicted amidohydrolase
MNTWPVACVQIDCLLGDADANLAAVLEGLIAAAQRGARLVIFPECVLSGYCFRSRAEALEQAQALPGPASDSLAAACRRLGVFAVVGLLERAGESLFNSCMLLGPDGLIATYRKIHLPFLGVDRFVTPGDRPFAVHDLGGLRVGMNICYDGTFPESARALALLGADLIVLPTNWPTGALGTIKLTEARALENHVYYAAVNRIGEERGFRFVGRSRVVGPDGEVMTSAPADHAEILLAEIDPRIARAKRVVKIPGEHEIDRIRDRRPEMYALLTARRE